MLKGYSEKLWNDKRGNALVIAGGAAAARRRGRLGDRYDPVGAVEAPAAARGRFGRDRGRLHRVYSSGRRRACGQRANNDNRDHEASARSAPAVGGLSPATAQWSTRSRELAVSEAVAVQLDVHDGGADHHRDRDGDVVPSGDYCVISLENTATTGITATGTPTSTWVAG